MEREEIVILAIYLFILILTAARFLSPAKAAGRRTYGVSQNAIHGRFITVIEPHEGQRKIELVEGVSENKVRISYSDGKWQEIEVQGIDALPVVELQTYENVCLISVEQT